jgi:2-keto-4-pentenoate hydratase/2-oxohepta-3-ene-1,7-dioic acid hydratase in catechol pathway
MQNSATAEMLFPPARLLAFLSDLITLEPGDVVTTGSPAGVGCFRDPPVYMKPGDTVTVSVDRIGDLTNPVEAGW